MANGFTKAVVILSIVAVNVSAKRTNIQQHRVQQKFSQTRTTQVSSLSKTPDKDWEGCAAWTNSGCESQEGCKRHPLWLDTRRQQCRYTDEFKLMREKILDFFPTEIARLEEKTLIFAAKGCITGGWWYKCYRRMQQMLRLFNYVRKAKGLVFKEGASHPAFAVMSQPATKTKFDNIAKNIAEGFSKNKETKDLCIGDGVLKMASIPDEIQAIKGEAEAVGVVLTDAEVASIEETKQTAALMKMNCAEMTEEQEEKMRAMMEASGEGEAQTVEPSAAPDQMDAMVQDQEDLVMLMEDDDLEHVATHAEEAGTDDSDEVDDHELEAPGSTGELVNVSALQLSGRNASLLELSSGDGPLKSMAKAGWKGIKWLARNGVGWLFRRLAWTLAFLVGFTFSVVRAFVLWPAMLVLCGSAKSVSWLFKDVLWNGDNIKEGFKSIGHCAPDMWEFVGFDTKDPANSAISQIITTPVKDASWVSGVYHPYKNGKPDYCADVTCGINAHCREVGQVGKCFCALGTYPATNGNCGQLQTRQGCVCESYWKSWGVGYYGCSRAGQCKVTKDCSENLSKGDGLLSRLGQGMLSAATGIKMTTDECTYQFAPSEVPQVQAPQVLRALGGK